MGEDDRRPTEQREALKTAALRMLLAERNWGEDAVPQDDEYEAGDALALAARAYVLALNAYGTRLWKMDDAEALRVRADELTEERDMLRAMYDRQVRVVSVFVDYHTKQHPLPDDVRKQVLVAMGEGRFTPVEPEGA